MGDVAKVIALDVVRASHKHQSLRQQLHERFDQWLDALERQLPAAELTLHQGSETIWGLPQPITGRVGQTIGEPRHQAEHRRTSLHCATYVSVCCRHARRYVAPSRPSWVLSS